MLRMSLSWQACEMKCEMDAWRLPHTWLQQRERHATFVGEHVAGTENVRFGIPLLQAVEDVGLWWAEEGGEMAGCPLGQARMKLTDYQLCLMGCPSTHWGTLNHLARFHGESHLTSSRKMWICINLLCTWGSADVLVERCVVVRCLRCYLSLRRPSCSTKPFSLSCSL